MKLENSKSWRLDWRSVKSIAIAFFVIASTFYINNIEAINLILEKYINPEFFKWFCILATYIAKKILTDYSK